MKNFLGPAPPLGSDYAQIPRLIPRDHAKSFDEFDECSLFVASHCEYQVDVAERGVVRVSRARISVFLQPPHGSAPLLDPNVVFRT
jgi:hypothetical protein